MADESHLSVLTQGIEQGHAVLADAVTAYTQALGERLVAAYALGSLAHGGFSPLVSDVDLALILADPLRPTDSVRVAAVAWGLKAKGSALHDRLSVFWGTPSSLAGRVPGGRFPPLDRLDLLEHGCLLQGEDTRSGLVPPDRDELLVAGALFALEYLAGLAVGTPHERTGQALGSLHRGRGVRRLTKLVLPLHRQRGHRRGDPLPRTAARPGRPPADQARTLPHPLPLHRRDGPGRHQRGCR
jgi:hypothetical protein